MMQVYSQSCLRTGYSSKGKCCKRVLKNVLYLYLVIFKTGFSKPSFTCPCNLIFSAILFKIVKLKFPYKLRVCNAICVAYRVVYKVVVSYILQVMRKRGIIIAFTIAPR